MIDVEDRFCRRCGAVTQAGRAAGVAPRGAGPPPLPKSSWQDNPWIVLAVVCLALGPLGLPMVWRCRGFERRGKLLATAAVLALTTLGLWLAYSAVMSALESLEQLQLQLR